MAGVVEALRRNTIGFLQDYFILLDVREQNRRLKADNDHLRLENVYFRNQLSTAEHAAALTKFQAQIPSRTVPARVFGNSTVVTAKAVFIDRGSTSGLEKGMAVVTPEGIVGKVAAVYPLVAQVLLVTDPTFKVGIESQKGHVHGVLNCGTGQCVVEQVQNEEKVDIGEWFFTSGEDRIFPKGFPVGTAVSVASGQGMKDIKMNLSGAPGGAEEVLVVLEGVHQNIPNTPPVLAESAKMLPPPTGSEANESTVKPQTEADKVLEHYEEVGKQQEHVYGAVGSGIPNFNIKKPGETTAANPPAQTEGPAPTNAGAPPSPTATAVKPLAAPAVLGSRPGAKGESPSVPRLTPAVPELKPKEQPAASRPVLPLGAPRKKPAGTSTSPATVAPSGNTAIQPASPPQ